MTASTLTTIAVFVPILFVEGIARQIFKDQALTVAYALLVSLVVSLTLTPMLAALGRSRGRRDRGPEAPGAVPDPSPSNGQDNPALGVLTRSYARLLAGSLRHRWVVVVLSAALFGGALLGGKTLGRDLIPRLSQGEFRFGIEFPEGTPIEHTDLVMRRVEEAVLKVPGVKLVYSTVGVNAKKGGAFSSKQENHAELNIRLEPGTRGERENAAIDAIRARLAGFENLTATLQLPTYFTFKTPVAVEIYGYDLAELGAVSDRVVAALRGIPGLRDVRSSMEPGSPEVQIRFDRDKLKAAGVDIREASRTLRTGILGRVATDYKDRDRQIDILVRSDEARNISFEELPSMVVGYRDALPVRLAAVASITVDRGPAEILRVSQSRAAVISANLKGRDLGSVSRDIEGALAAIPLPSDVSVELGGQNEEMRASLRSLLFAVALAVFMVYLVMASQFESLLNPFLILFAVPLALIGVVGALLLTATPVSIVVMIGGIMLAGIVVNNGIVLVDLIGRLQRRGRSVEDAIMEGGRTRLRPILMTTTTTVLALFPMAVGWGEGGEIGAPLAVTVIGGLLVSTLLTLVVIPVLYSFTHRNRPPAGEGT